MKSLSPVRLFATPWTAAYQAPPSTGFSRQEYWSELSFPPPGDLPDPGIKPMSPASPPQMIGKPGTSTTALACACYPWSSSSQPFSLGNTPQYFEKYITDPFLPSLQRSNLFPCYYAYKPKPPFFCPLIPSFGVSLWVFILSVKIITATIHLGLLLLMILPPFSSAGILRVIFLTYISGQSTDPCINKFQGPSK